MKPTVVPQQKRPSRTYRKIRPKSVPNSPSNTSMDQGSNGSTSKYKKWTEWETTHFIQLYTSALNSYDADKNVTLEFYSKLVAPMAEAGSYYRNAAQLRQKWNSLKRNYIIESKIIKKNRDATLGPFFHLLDEMLGCKPQNCATAYLCEVVSNSPIRNKNPNINTKYNSDTDFTKVGGKNEPSPQSDALRTGLESHDFQRL